MSQKGPVAVKGMLDFVEDLIQGVNQRVRKLKYH